MKIKIPSHHQTPPHKINPVVFPLLMRIINNIDTPSDGLAGFKNNDLVIEVVNQVKDGSDKLETPIFRIENKFFIYVDGKPLHISNKGFEKFLLMVCDRLNIDKVISTNIPFRNQMFGRSWWVLKPEE